ncbi:MAG: hypothetical protein ACRCUQ_01215 [Alphaproteobacteria bacterium]
MKMASIYLSKDVLRIVTFSKTTVGLSSAYYPIFFLKISDRPSEIGKKALEALDGFTVGVPHPKNQEEHRLELQQFCERMQIKSWRGFLKGTKEVDLELETSGLIKITPMINFIDAKIKGRGDFYWLYEKTRLSSTDPEELGRAILAAFEDCE